MTLRVAVGETVEPVYRKETPTKFALIIPAAFVRRPIEHAIGIPILVQLRAMAPTAPQLQDMAKTANRLSIVSIRGGGDPLHNPAYEYAKSESFKVRRHYYYDVIYSSTIMSLINLSAIPSLTLLL